MRVIKECSGKSIVQKRFKTDVNINSIVEKARVRGLPAPQNRGFFGDFTGIDFEGMQNTVARAQEAFMALPSKLRARFGNSAQNLLEFIEDENNINEAIALGLVPMPEEKTEEKPAVPAVTPATT